MGGPTHEPASEHQGAPIPSVEGHWQCQSPVLREAFLISAYAMAPYAKLDSVENPSVEARYVAIKDCIQRDLAAAVPVVRIPGWEPTDLTTGLEWLRGNVFQGFEVDYLVDRTGDSTRLWLKSWEYWDPEDPSDSEVPTWDQVKAIPIAAPDDRWFR